MVSQQLVDYIKQQLGLGKNRADITPVLLNAGWKQEDINEAFNNIEGHPAAVSPTAVPASGELPSYNQLFKDAWLLLIKSFRAIVLSGLTLIGGFLLLASASGGIWFLVYKFAGQMPALIVGVVLGLIVFISYIYAILWGVTACITAMRDANENPGAKENLKRSQPFIGRVFWVRILSGLIAAGGFVLFIIPGIILSIRYAFSSFVAVNENQKGRMALAQSYSYVYGRTGKVFLRFIALYVIYLVPLVILNSIIKFANNPALYIGARVIVIILQILFAFYSLTFLYTLYLELKASAIVSEPQKYIRRATWWAVWGVFGIIVLAAGIAFGSVKYYQKTVRERDDQRIKDVGQITVSLGLYYKDYGHYPAKLSDLSQGYIQGAVPTAPKPADGTCTKEENEYSYKLSQDMKNYELDFCLGEATNNYQAGLNKATGNN